MTPTIRRLPRTETTLDSAGTAALAERIRRAPADAYLALDTETGGGPAALEAFGDKATFHPYAGSYLTGVSVALVLPGDTRLEGFYVPVGHQRGNVDPGAFQGLLRALCECPGMSELHHAVFDWPFLALAGPFQPSRRTIDTQVLRWLQDENAGKRLKEDLGEVYLDEDAGAEKRALRAAMNSPWENQTHAYKAVREAYPELPVKDARAMARRMRANRGWHQLEVEELGKYAARDATLTHEVREVLDALAPGVSTSRAFEREMELQHVLYDMTRKGVGVDIAKLDACEKLYGERAEELRDGLDHEFRGRLGLAANKRFNPSSSAQCQRLLFDELGLPVMLTTETGAPATDKNALEMLQGDPVAKRILEYRKWEHARTSYAIGFAKCAKLSFDNRIHGHYRSDSTVTGRLSASGPNVMTIPREDSLPELRAAFHYTEPGMVRYGYDLASAELWVTASLTQDPVLTEVLLEGRNLHSEMMVQVFGGEADKHRREYTLSKNVNYGIEYGAGLDQIAIFAAKAGYAPAEAKRVAGIARDGHKRLFARQHRVADFLADKARQRGTLPLHVPGRYRHFNTPGRAVGYYTALNALVQGGVAEFMKDTMLEVYRRGYGELLILQVHDELVFDAPPGMDDELRELLQSISHDINPFRYELRWEGKQWASA